MNKVCGRYKFIVGITSKKKEKSIDAVYVIDENGNYKKEDYMEERGIRHFQNIQDLKETLNWNLNGDPAKFSISWETPTRGFAAIYD